MVIGHGRSTGGDNRGFSLVELLIVMVISSLVLGTAMMISIGVQKASAHQQEDIAVQQEARHALDWIRRTLVAAGSNPYLLTTSSCPSPGTPFVPIRLDPNGNGLQDDIRVQADINPPNGALLGLSGSCGETGEDVTIAHNPATNQVTRVDLATEASPVPMTDTMFTQLVFSYLTAGRVATSNPAAIAYVQVALTGRSRAMNLQTRTFTSFTFNSEIRLRSR